MQPLLKPKSLQEVRKYLIDFSKQLREEEQLIDQNTKQLARIAAKAITAAEDPDVMDISGVGSNKPKRKRTLNVDFPVVKVPNADALKKNYVAAERLSEQYKYLQTLENEVRMNFKGTKGSALDAALGSIKKLQQDVTANLKKLFVALSQVAEGHAPKEYKTFVKALAVEIYENKHVDCDSVKSMSYAALDKEGELVFAGYIILTNAVSDEGKVAPTLYVVVKWTVGGDVEIFVEHEFVAPGLLQAGETVENIQQAGKVVASQLSMEGFSQQIGNLPAEMQLKERELKPELFSVSEHLQGVNAKEDELIFTFKSGTKSDAIKDMSTNLFQDVKSMLKKKRSTKVRMQIRGNQVVFTFVGLDVGHGVSPFDLEWLGTKFKLSLPTLRKLANTINNDPGISASAKKVQAAPISKGEWSRFKAEIVKLDPVFGVGVKDNGYGFGGDFIWFKKAQAEKALSVLKKNGWEASHIATQSGDVYTLTKDGKWPILLRIDGEAYANMTLPSDDTKPGRNAVADEFVIALKKMAKSVLPSGFTINGPSAEWRKRGGHAGSNALSVCIQRAEAAGFKAESNDPHGSPDGSTMGHTDTFRHPDGWTLNVRSSYGSTAADNNYMAALTFDARRGA